MSNESRSVGRSSLSAANGCWARKTITPAGCLKPRGAKKVCKMVGLVGKDLGGTLAARQVSLGRDGCCQLPPGMDKVANKGRMRPLVSRPEVAADCILTTTGYS